MSVEDLLITSNNKRYLCCYKIKINYLQCKRLCQNRLGSRSNCVAQANLRRVSERCKSLCALFVFECVVKRIVNQLGEQRRSLRTAFGSLGWSTVLRQHRCAAVACHKAFELKLHRCFVRAACARQRSHNLAKSLRFALENHALALAFARVDMHHPWPRAWPQCLRQNCFRAAKDRVEPALWFQSQAERPARR